jgi:type 1 glutamine amidotransferase
MEPTGGTGITTTGGVGGTNAGGTGGASTGGAPPVGPYEPRSGSFKMLGYSRTTGYRHDSISAGKQLLMQIAAEQGFEIKFTETNEDITLEGLSQYEIVFFMNTSGDIFNQTEEQAFEEWMTTKNGAFAGVHSATDTENGWRFYSEVTGQYYNNHGTCCPSGQILIAENASDFPAFTGLPNPWIRTEEWFNFNEAAAWSLKPGFKILAEHGEDRQPVTWVREFGNFRSFYSSIGHQGSTFQEPLVKKHLTGGIMWAVRREHLIR